MTKNYTAQTVRIATILLDQENPRFPAVNSQREAIQTMLDDQGDKIVNLASDIYQNGLNPSSKLILFKDAENLVDGDGNRRLTALKILETPSLCDSVPRIRKKIDSILRQKGEAPTEVDCVVFENRDAVRHWISINHSGPQEGKGQLSWDSEQKDRFEGRFTIGLQALDLLGAKKLITSGDKARVNKTTLDRLLSYKKVKDRLKIEQSGGVFSFGKQIDLTKVVLALRDAKVDMVYTADKGAAFVESVLAGDGDEAEQTDKPLGSHGQGFGDQPSTKNDRGTSDQYATGLVLSDTRNIVNPGGQTAARTRRKDVPKPTAFGGSLSLRPGHVNNLYRDIEQVYSLYGSKKISFSDDFIVIFRMSLRLLAETAARESGKGLDAFLLENFDSAKKILDQDTRTLLSSQSVEKSKIVQLFQTGAHDYANSRNEEQALALSIILGTILALTNGKN